MVFPDVQMPRLNARSSSPSRVPRAVLDTLWASPHVALKGLGINPHPCSSEEKSETQSLSDLHKVTEVTLREDSEPGPASRLCWGDVCSTPVLLARDKSGGAS